MGTMRRRGFWRRHSRPRAKTVRIVEYPNLPQWSSGSTVERSFHVVLRNEGWGLEQSGRHFARKAYFFSFIILTIYNTVIHHTHFCFALCVEPCQSTRTSVPQVDLTTFQETGRDGLVLGRHCNGPEASGPSTQLRCHSSSKPAISGTPPPETS